MRNDPDLMEMPCMCDCGNWFDLTDGYAKKRSNIVICEECHQVEQEIEDIETQIEDLEMQEGHHKREINQLKKQLAD